MLIRSVLTSAVVLAACTASAQNGSIDVDAKSNIFGYGVSAPEPSGGGGGINAPVITLDPGTGRSLTFLAVGEAGWNFSLLNGPDGGNFASATNIPSLGPISGYAAPLSGHLVGLFIEAGDISALLAPGGISYPDLASFGQSSYSPGLRQVFFMGDGLTGTGSGSTQTFNVPDGAAMLVLGIADAFGFSGPAGWYSDNVGGYTVRYDIVPAPSAAALLGLSALGLKRRRR